MFTSTKAVQVCKTMSYTIINKRISMEVSTYTGIQNVSLIQENQNSVVLQSFTVLPKGFQRQSVSCTEQELVSNSFVLVQFIQTFIASALLTVSETSTQPFALVSTIGRDGGMKRRRREHSHYFLRRGQSLPHFLGRKGCKKCTISFKKFENFSRNGGFAAAFSFGATSKKSRNMQYWTFLTLRITLVVRNFTDFYRIKNVKNANFVRNCA